LHTDRAMKSLDYKPRPAEHYRLSGQKNALIQDAAGNFAASAIVLDKSGARHREDLKGSFAVLTVLKGRVEVGRLGPVKRGHSVLVPAAAESYEITALEAPAEIIKSYVP